MAVTLQVTENTANVITNKTVRISINGSPLIFDKKGNRQTRGHQEKVNLKLDDGRIVKVNGHCLPLSIDNNKVVRDPFTLTRAEKNFLTLVGLRRHHNSAAIIGIHVINALTDPKSRISVTDLSELSGISRTAAGGNVTRLVDIGILRQKDLGQGKGKLSRIPKNLVDAGRIFLDQESPEDLLAEIEEASEQKLDPDEALTPYNMFKRISSFNKVQFVLFTVYGILAANNKLQPLNTLRSFTEAGKPFGIAQEQISQTLTPFVEQGLLTVEGPIKSRDYHFSKALLTYARIMFRGVPESAIDAFHKKFFTKKK